MAYQHDSNFLSTKTTAKLLSDSSSWHLAMGRPGAQHSSYTKEFALMSYLYIISTTKTSSRRSGASPFSHPVAMRYGTFPTKFHTLNCFSRRKKRRLPTSNRPSFLQSKLPKMLTKHRRQVKYHVHVQ